MAAARIAVLGAGSVGCFIGGCWQAAGLPVSFIGRAGFAHDIREHGLTLSDFSGWEARLTQVDFACVPAALADAEIILLCVKSGATADAARDIAQHAADGALVISFQNGVSNFDVLSEMLGGHFRIVRGMVPFNVAYLGEGRVHKGVAGELWAERRVETDALAQTVGAGAAALRLADDMVSVAWGKLLINLNNAVNALSGRTLLEQLSERDYRRVVAASQREGLRLLKAARIKPATIGAASPRLLPRLIDSPDWLFRKILLRKWKIDARARSSMADDLAAGRTTEVDYINGELVALAERLGMDAPVNRKIVELIRRAEAGAPPWSPVDLRREILGR